MRWILLLGSKKTILFVCLASSCNRRVSTWFVSYVQQFERLFLFVQKVENLLLSVEPEKVCHHLSVLSFYTTFHELQRVTLPTI
jgi:hypothetical protein